MTAPESPPIPTREPVARLLEAALAGLSNAARTTTS